MVTKSFCVIAALFQTSEPLFTYPISSVFQTSFVLIDGYFHGWKNNQDDQTFEDGIKNGDVMFLNQENNKKKSVHGLLL